MVTLKTKEKLPDAKTCITKYRVCLTVDTEDSTSITLLSMATYVYSNVIETYNRALSLVSLIFDRQDSRFGLKC